MLLFTFIVYICLVSLLHTFCMCWTHAITTVQHVTVDAASVTTSSDAAAVQMCRVRQKIKVYFEALYLSQFLE